MHGHPGECSGSAGEHWGPGGSTWGRHRPALGCGCCAGGQPRRGGRGTARRRQSWWSQRGDSPGSSTASGAFRGGAGAGAAATRGLSCSSCPQASGSTAGGRRRGGGYGFRSASPLLLAAGDLAHPPCVSATSPRVTPLPLLFAPQTRKRGGPVAAGRPQEMLRAGSRAPRGCQGWG